MENNNFDYMNLLPKMQKEIETELTKSKKIGKILSEAKFNNISYETAFKYSQESGKIIRDVLERNLKSSIFPDGKLYKSTAEKLLLPILEKNYKDVDYLTTLSQMRVNEQLKTSIAVQKSKKAVKRAKGIVNYISEGDFEKRKRSFFNKIETYSKKHIDEAIEINAKFLAEAGFKTSIIRNANACACKWCRDLAGIYNYDDVSDTGNDVFRRHDNCNCTVTYKSERTSKNVHTRKSLSEKQIKELENEIMKT